MIARRFWPLLLFVPLLGLLGLGLGITAGGKQREIPSPLLGKAAPAFSLPTLAAPARQLGPGDMRGQVWLLNVWASWCAPCREEHPTLIDMARTGGVPLLGLNYKDKPADARIWLQRYGDPYLASVSDVDGLAGIDWGVYGVPETFVIDKAGIVRRKFVGPVTAEVYRQQIAPLVAQLKS